MTTESNNHFGYEKVSDEQKRHKVNDLFSKVSSKYDLMNDVMSLGTHRLWKTIAVDLATIREDMHILDVATGSGDLIIKIAPKLSESSRLVASDINQDMLNVARDRLADKGLVKGIEFVKADAEELPFAENSFDLITIAFGLRNVARIDKALAGFYKILKPSGKLLILEFSKPQNPIINQLYEFWSFKAIPLMGQIIANDKASYQYLVESIRMHPDQQKLKQMLEEAGFVNTRFSNINSGIVAIHQGIKAN